MEYPRPGSLSPPLRVSNSQAREKTPKGRVPAPEVVDTLPIGPARHVVNGDRHCGQASDAPGGDVVEGAVALSDVREDAPTHDNSRAKGCRAHGSTSNQALGGSKRPPGIVSWIVDLNLEVSRQLEIG